MDAWAPYAAGIVAAVAGFVVGIAREKRRDRGEDVKLRAELRADATQARNELRRTARELNDALRKLAVVTGELEALQARHAALIEELEAERAKRRRRQIRAVGGSGGA